MSAPSPSQLIVRCDSSSFKKVHDFVRQNAVRAGFNRTDVGRLVLAVDEVCSNIVKHAYRFEPNHKLTLSWRDRQEGTIVEIEDDSPVPYLPSPADFDLSTKIKYRHANGFGKYLIRQVVDDVQFETVPGSHNKVSLIKFKTGHTPARKKEVMKNPYDLARARALSLMTLFEVGASLSQQKNLEGLMKVFLYAVMGRLTTQPVALLAPLSPASPFVVVGEVGLSKRLAVSEIALPRHGWVVETLWAQRGPFLANEFQRIKIPEEEMESLRQLQAALLIPLFILNQLLGILALGPKRSGQAFSEEDVNLMTFLGNYVLLLMENVDRGTPLGGVPAKSGGELRAAIRAALARLAKASQNCRINLEFPEVNALPHLKIDADLLNKLILTLLTHIVYLTPEGESVSIQLNSEETQAVLRVTYPGTPLAFEKGKPGYNALIDQMMAGSLRLSECRKAAQSGGGHLNVQENGPKVILTLTLPFAT